MDADGYVRQAMAYLDYEGVREYSLSSQVYRIYQESRGEEAVFPSVHGRNNRFYFTYSGRPGGYSIVSMADVLDGTVNPAIFQDAVVLVGAYAVGMQDAYMPAIAHNSQMYGVEIHANIIEAMLEGKTQLPIPPLVYALAAALLCGVFYLCSEKMRMRYSTVLLAALVALDIIFAKVMYGNGRIVPVILLPVCLLVIYLAQMARGYLAEIMRRRRVVNVFKQYVAPQVVDKISKDKDFELVIGGENRHIAVLFVDIRGFTTMSESLKPEEVVEILNEYLGLTTQAIFDNGGTLDKFVGTRPWRSSTRRLIWMTIFSGRWLPRGTCRRERRRLPKSSAKDTGRACLLESASIVAMPSWEISVVTSGWTIRPSGILSIRRQDWRATRGPGRY